MELKALSGLLTWEEKPRDAQMVAGVECLAVLEGNPDSVLLKSLELPQVKIRIEH